MSEACFTRRPRVVRYSARGVPFLVARDEPVPRIGDDNLDCVLYLYRSEDEAWAGEHAGGSGFVLKVPAERLPHPPHGFLYAVTNRHVIDGGACTVRMNTPDGSVDVIPSEPSDWYLSETDDLAVGRLVSLPPDRFRYRTVAEEMFLTEDLVQRYNVGIGDEVYLVGRFINHDGRQRNAPTARFGVIAQMPGEAVRLPAGNAISEQVGFMVEVRSISGFSGSPVFLRMDPLLTRPDRPGVSVTRNYLLGVNWGHVLGEELEVLDGAGRPFPHYPLAGAKVLTNSGLGGVVPAWRLRDLLYRPDVLQDRREAEERHIQRVRPAPGVLASAGGSDGAEEA